MSKRKTKPIQRQSPSSPKYDPNYSPQPGKGAQMSNGQRVRKLRKAAAKDEAEHEKLKQMHEKRRRRQARMSREQR